jgi:DNA-binding transcriptional MerR regulator
MNDKLITKNGNNFRCETCDFSCSWKSNFDKHLLTAKHIRLTTTSIKMGEYVCVCGKKYKQRQGLHKHKKTCKGKQSQDPQEDSSISTSLASSDLVIRLLQETKEMRDAMTQQNQFIQNQSELHQQQMREQQEQHNKQIQELIPKIQATTINNTNTNSNNTTNKFNLNFFLNEQCKDAISIQTFIRDLNIGIKELEHMGNVGYLQGMISIMSNTLGAMDIYKRPVHCTDLKREAIYIKDGDTWKKDNANNDDLKRVIDRVADKNYRNLALWEADHPEAFESDTPDNIEYCKIALESLGGGDTTDEKALSKLKKIVKHVVREVYVR